MTMDSFDEYRRTELADLDDDDPLLPTYEKAFKAGQQIGEQMPKKKAIIEMAQRIAWAECCLEGEFGNPGAEEESAASILKRYGL